MFDDNNFENQMKKELIPVISNHLGVSEQLLSNLPVNILNRILTSINIIPDEKLKKIIVINAPHAEKIPDLLDEALGMCSVSESEEQTVPNYDPCLDLRAGILALIPENFRDEVEEKINEIDDVHRLSELSRKPIDQILVDLGVESETNIPEPEEYDQKRDIIAGILAMVPDENLKDDIKEKLNEIDDINRIVKLASMEYVDFLRELGLEEEITPIGTSNGGQIPRAGSASPYTTPASMPTMTGRSNRPTNMKDDIKAGIIARLPPSVRTFVQEKIMAINDMDKLIKLSTMNYLQIQSELGVPISSPALAPPSVVNPVDTQARKEQESMGQASGQPRQQAPKRMPERELDEETRERLRKRKEENKKYVDIITRIVEKASKNELPDNYDRKIKVLQRVYPDRLKRLMNIFKSQKKRNRILLMFEWFVISQRIEEIETYVEHWQGATERAGGFRAAIGVSRYDSVIEDLKNKELEEIINTSKRALQKIHDQNVQVRAVGVEEIKSIANILLQKVR
ncbi:MAG: hypothetical protein GF329_18970 [Candidatus Lokiarchaeota archaeon]|nr:hypothetical protein [Candidatus Lokiarchaeota archaeon]